MSFITVSSCSSRLEQSPPAASAVRVVVPFLRTKVITKSINPQITRVKNAQEAMKNTLSVYTIAQFSRSFLTIKEPEKAGTWNTQIKSQVLLFTYFVMWICNRINQDYKQLAKQMEYDADDVAIQYMGRANLQRTLLHAACIQYNYTMLQWGAQILAEQSMQVDNPYAALYFIGQYNHPTKDLLPAEIICRLERVGELSNIHPSCTSTVRDTTRQQIQRTNGEESTCSAVQFAEWLRD